jgi:central kinetochore subunit Mis15/CHL4
LSIPSLDPLPHSIRIPSSHALVFRTLSKLSRPTLFRLAAEWCSTANRDTCGPHIAHDYEPDDPSAPWTAANNIDELAQLYEVELAGRKGSKRELLDRILEGDWRHGISLQQMAMVDMQAIVEHPSSMRWSAFHIAPHQQVAGDKKLLPRIHGPALILALHREIAALAKAHYYIARLKSHPLTVLRIAVFETPYSADNISLTSEVISQSKVFFIAFPDNAPFVYISRTTQATSTIHDESTSLQAFIIKAIPVALSRHHARYELKPTQLTARSLDALLAMRGPGRDSGVAGGWSTYADEDSLTSAMQVVPPRVQAEGDKENMHPDSARTEISLPRPPKRTFSHAEPTAHLPSQRRKRLKQLAVGRFGVTGEDKDKKALTRFDVKVDDELDGATALRPSLKFEFQGTHVFAGLRKLVEAGVIDGEKMPAWMTGEGNVSAGVVRHGKIQGWYGMTD